MKLCERIDLITQQAAEMLLVAAAGAGKTRAKNATKAALAKISKDADGKHSAMAEIHDEWKSRKAVGARFKAIDFAREMHKRHRGAVTLEAIKNAQTRWNKEYHPAS
jgi:hypothetical protein